MKKPYSQRLKDRYLGLVAELKPRLERRTYRLTRNSGRSRILYKDTVSQGLIEYPKLKQERAFPRFMYRIAERLNIKSWFNPFTRRWDDTPVEEVAYSSDSPEAATDYSILLSILEKLDEADKNVLTIHALEDNNQKRTAQILGVTVRSVERQLARARRNFIKMLGEEYAAYYGRNRRHKRTPSTSDKPSLIPTE